MSILRASCVTAVSAVLLVGMQSATLSAGVSAASTIPSPTSRASSPGHAAADNEVVETRYADRILDDLKAKYRYLDGVTVSIGTTPLGEQAVAYYTEGRVVVSRTHSVDTATILAHEIWHIIDWRDNGRIDWGENLPPSDSGPYRKR